MRASGAHPAGRRSGAATRKRRTQRQRGRGKRAGTRQRARVQPGAGAGIGVQSVIPEQSTVLDGRWATPQPQLNPQWQ
eukprot:scaffold29979_cov132-Isochrysis_galbana.AAC.2